MITLLLTKWLGEKGIADAKALLTSKYFWIILGLVLISGFSAYKGYSYEKAKYKAETDKILAANAAQARVDKAAIESNKLDSIILEAKIKEIQGDSNEQINKANTATNDALHALSLQQRANRPTKSNVVVPQSTAVGSKTYSTGKDLYADDARFLIWYAGQYQDTVILYNQCVASYNEVRDKINSQKQTVLPEESKQ